MNNQTSNLQGQEHPIEPLKVLHLNVKGEYFDQIKSGEKVEDYRLHNDYWKKRLDRDYDLIQIKRGYPKRDDWTRIEARVYRGYRIKTITHPHFGSDPVEVFAIWVN